MLARKNTGLVLKLDIDRNYTQSAPINALATIVDN